jgi:hypothetical protein
MVKTRCTVDGATLTLEGYGGECARWDVSFDGVRLGDVCLKVTRYNLRRTLTSRGWYGYSDSRVRIPERGEFATRSEALTALLRWRDADLRTKRL